MSEFLRPHMRGSRFDQGTIPLDMLSDLSVLGEMVVEVAKWRYLEAHPDRKRSPKGFANRVSLKLVGVDEGSAIPAIDMEPYPPQLEGMPVENAQYFFEARDAIIGAIAAAERNDPPSDFLPPKYLAFFDRFGRRLRDGESIEFPTGPGTPLACLTKDSRRRLLLASQVTEITQEVDVRCYIHELNQDLMTFELKLLNGRKIKSEVEEHHRDIIMDVFTDYRDGAKALVHGIGKCDLQDRLVALEVIEDIAILDPLDVPSRLHELSELDDGWLDGEGKAPKAEFLEQLSEMYNRLYPDSLPMPYIYPTIVGGVQAEWSLPPHEITLAIDPETRSAEWHVLDADDSTESVETLNLSDAQDWVRLSSLVRSLV